MKIRIAIFLIVCALRMYAPCAAKGQNREQHIAAINQLISEATQQNRDTDSASAMLHTVIRLSGQTRYYYGIYKGSYSLSGIYIGQGNIKQAIDLLEPLILDSTFYDTAVQHLRPNLYLNIANAYMLMGNYHKTLEMIDKISALVRRQPDHPVDIYGPLSYLLCALPESYQPGGYKKALFYIRKAQDKALLRKDTINYAMLLNNEGHIYMKCRDWKNCSAILQKTIQLCRQKHIKTVLPLALITSGEAAYYQEKYGEAERYLLQAVHMNGEAGKLQTQYGNIILGKTYMKRKAYDKADHVLEETLRTVLQHHYFTLNKDLYEALSGLRLLQGDYKSSLMYYKRYQAIQDSITGKEVANTVQHLDIRYKTAEKDKELLKRQLFIRQQEKTLDTRNFQVALMGMGISGISIIFLFYYSRLKQKRKWIAGQQDLEQLRAVVKGEEQERARIARELHDGIGGMLAVIGMNLSHADKDGTLRPEQISKLKDLVKTTSHEVRQTAHNLLPNALEQSNLAEAIEDYCNEITHTSDLLIDVETRGDFSFLDITFSIAIFRIVQELIRNIIKHSGASHVVIMVDITARKINMEVEDNGRGFDPGVKERTGMGLKNIKDRVGTLGGVMHIASNENLGTRVNINFENLQKK